MINELKRNYMCKVTVIMPSLNVVRYIAKCLDSVVGQTLEDIEVLAIDAGSTDGTSEIIQSYADRDSRIHFIYSDRKSYGYQVNLGLSMAQGEYIGIVETDDWIESEAYEVLYQFACQYEADYVRGVAENYKEVINGLPYSYPINIFSAKEYEKNKGVIQINPQKQKDIVIKDRFLWNGIYKRDFLKGIKLNETAGAAYQDIGFLLQVYNKATNAVYIDKLVYHYRKDNEDCSCNSRSAFRYLVEEYKFVHEHLEPEDEIRKLYIDAKYFYQIYARFNLMVGTGEYWEEAKPYIDEMYNYFRGKKEVIPFLGEQQREGYGLFIDSPMKLYESLREKSIYEQSEWETFLNKLIDREIVIFGSGKRGYFLQILLCKRNVGHVLGYCDNDCTKIGKELHGLIVRPLNEWIRNLESHDICYVVTAMTCMDEIEKQLLESGISHDNIVLFKLPRNLSIL